MSIEVPKSTKINTLDANALFGASRVVDFARAFMELNNDWFQKANSKISGILAALPSELRGANGDDFLVDNLRDTAFAYAVVQIMRPGTRLDPRHFDGGASILHMGLTVWGQRCLHCFFEDGKVGYKQSAGSVYIGNLVAVEHEVKHYNAAAAGPLYHPEGCLEKDSKGLLVTVMFRCDVFRHCMARQLKHPPAPADVYGIVNDVLARQLAEYPLRLPSWAEVASRAAASAVRKRKAGCDRPG